MPTRHQADKERVFLATTAIEEFWDTSKPVVFLGDWCCRYSRQSIWKPLNGEVLQGIWKDKKRFIDVYIYLQDVYERLLQQMAELLDEVHGERHNIRYWRIIIGPWLSHYIDILYDRYLCIQQAKSKYPLFDTIVLSEDSFITPQSTWEFVYLSTNDPYNLQIYSRILSIEKNNFRQKSFDIVRKVQPIRKNNLLGVIKKKCITFVRSIAMAKTGKAVYLIDPYFSKSTIIKIFLKSKGKVKPVFQANEEMPVATLCKSMRSCFGKIMLKHNEFEKLIVQLLPYDIPCSLLESHKMIKKKSLSYPSKPRAIMSWVSWYFDEKFKIWAAMATESGCTLYGVQHGGNYGIDQYMRALDHEVKITDKFYSWGWNDSELKERIVPINMTTVIGSKKFQKNNRNTKILFAGTALPRYLYRLQYPTNDHVKKYCEDQIRFFESLAVNFHKCFRYRPCTIDFGLGIVERIQDLWPNMIVEGWDIPFQESLMNCRLFVCDDLGSVHAEALSLNAPTILFWDPDSMICRREAIAHLDNLRAVGILHDSPESAASKVCEVYNNVDEWWNDRERQLARVDFCDRYAKTPQNGIDEWINEFRKISR